MHSIEKLGSKKHPIRVSVWDEEAVGRVAKICDQQGWYFIAKIDPDEDENVEEFLAKLASQQIGVSIPVKLQPSLAPMPNNFCPCDSGKKYKKCCMRAVYPPAP